MPKPPKPTIPGKAVPLWERQPDEPLAAFRCFQAYRDLDGPRSVPKAYRQKRGKEGAKQAPGKFNLYAKKYRWSERAAAWDNRAEGLRQRAREEIIVKDASQWARARVEEAEKAYQFGRKLREKADDLLDRPQAPGDLQRLATTGAMAQKLIDDVIERMDPSPQFLPTAKPTLTPEQADRLGTILERELGAIVASDSAEPASGY